MKQKEFHQLLQNRFAETSVSSSSLRNQGSAGIVSAARKFCTELPLHKFNVKSQKQFDKTLDESTNNLLKKFPEKARNNWGAARKTLNLFLREVLYNTYLSKQFNSKVIYFLEIPLDGYVARNILAHPRGKNLAKWKSIKSLKKDMSDEYQKIANQIASDLSVPRIHLDLIFWRNKT